MSILRKGVLGKNLTITALEIFVVAMVIAP